MSQLTTHEAKTNTAASAKQTAAVLYIGVGRTLRFGSAGIVDGGGGNSTRV